MQKNICSILTYLTVFLLLTVATNAHSVTYTYMQTYDPPAVVNGCQVKYIKEQAIHNGAGEFVIGNGFAVLNGDYENCRDLCASWRGDEGSHFHNPFQKFAFDYNQNSEFPQIFGRSGEDIVPIIYGNGKCRAFTETAIMECKADFPGADFFTDCGYQDDNGNIIYEQGGPPQ